MKAQEVSKNNPEAGRSGDCIRKIEKCAYDLFLNRGGVPGGELNDWLTAEKIVHCEEGQSTEPKGPA